MSALYEHLATALPIAADGILHDISPEGATRRQFIGAIMRLEDERKRTGVDIPTDARVDGRGVRVDMQVAVPVSEGFDAKTATLAQHKMPAARNFNHVAGEMDWSTYRGSERILKDSVQRLGSAPSVEAITNLAMVVAKSVVSGQLAILDDHLWPTVQVSPSVGYRANDAVMAVRYPLQTGYASMAATGSGSFSYLGHDLNDGYMVNAKAVVSGSVASGFGVPSLSSIRTNILMPLREKRKANVRFAFTDFGIVDYMITQGESKLQINQSDAMIFGSDELARYGGVTYVPSARHQDQVDAGLDRCIDFFDPSTWKFFEAGMNDITTIQNVPDEPSVAALLQWFWKCLIICTNPRLNGLAYKVTLS
ncbi:MAG: hypothetical protein KIS66_16775 [Fimbriimonadaceae bacterium]|nr:hypothetical protein [Fimbriimonadaceae bacterium]